MDSEVQEPKFVSDRQVYARDAKQCLIEVESVTNNLALPGGTLIPIGTSRALIMEKDLPLVEALVETPAEKAEWDQAVDQLARDKKIALDKRLEAAENAEDRADIAAEFEARWMGSPNAVLRRLFDRDRKPLMRCNVIEPGLTNLGDVARIEAEKAAAAHIADALRPAANSAVGLSAEQLTQIGEVAARAAAAAVVAGLAAERGKSK